MISARSRFGGLTATAVLVAASLASCGDDSERAQCGSWERGDITFATGPDVSVGRELERRVRAWRSNDGKRAQLVSLPPGADGQRSQLVATAQAQPSRYDVLGLDVVWTAEFASRGYVQQLDRRFKRHELNRHLRQPLETARWEDKLWAIPLNTGVGLLFYRTDRGVSAPKSFEDLESMASDFPKDEGFAGQFRAYEGLTVNLLEAVWDAGGDVLADGKPVLNPDAAQDALARLRAGFNSGWIDREALHYGEQETLTAFQEGHLVFMRNWPDAYITLKKGQSSVSDDFRVAPLPKAGALGGKNLAIAACSNNKETALEFIRDMTGTRAQEALFERGGYPPTLKTLYEPGRYVDKTARSLASTLKKALSKAKLRPRQAGYTQASQIIQRNAYEALRGRMTPFEAIESIESELGNARLD